MQNDEEGKMVVVVGSRAHMEEESVVQVEKKIITCSLNVIH